MDNSGAIFNNERKEKPNHPDRTGQATIGGVDYWVSGWLKEKGGKKYLSLAFKVKDAPKSNSKPQGRQQNADEDIPW